ncbi:MAG: hypothetical protein ACLR8Y_09545 [Alistipes indistinctus]
MRKRLYILLFLFGLFPSVYGQQSADNNYVLLLNSASFGEAWSDVLYKSLVEDVQQLGVRVDTGELLVPMMKTAEDARLRREMLLEKYPARPGRSFTSEIPAGSFAARFLTRSGKRSRR